ncbi:Uma2 family endonuclease [Azoarcus taiwanensis]|uniref:Uma2 family endonuclease n=1 Tax=Azoarcus taiwanensis TaxID=666964 RepID=A0A972FE77_9RHOO|nr:Uma2 family endonuclease [Azoarcus taiwanensis]NMG03090.1 Uma2 family endonuclease [Azoarcus taiwanensis]
MGLPLRDHQHHTYSEYLTWPDDVRYELIDGQAVMMAPAPNLDHQDIVGELFYQIRQQLEGKPCRPFIAPVDVRLPRGDEANEDIDTVVQPDVIIVCDPGKLDRRGVRGAPDWVAEVLSPSTAAHDQVVKRRIYERARVPEYWLVHPNDRTLTIYTLRDGAYGRPDIFELKETTRLQTMPELEIAWDALVERLPKQEF